MYLTLAEIQAFINFVNGNLGKKIFADTNPSTVVSGKKLITNGVGLGVDIVDDIAYQLGIVNSWDIGAEPAPPVDLQVGQRFIVTTEGTYNGVFADVGDIVEFTSLTSIFVYPLASTFVRLNDLTDYATKTYAESLVVGLLDDRGSYDPTITSKYPTAVNNGSGDDGAILKGDIWFFSSDGVCGVGNNVLAGYSIRALVDYPDQIDSNWNILSVGLGYVSENVDNKRTSTNGALTSPDDITYPSTLVVDDALNLKANILNETHTGAMRLPSSLKIYDVISTTKEVAVNISGLTAGTPRTVTFPDRDIALGDLPLFAATTKYRRYAIIQKDGLLYSAKTQFTSGSTFDVADWDSIGGVSKAQITGNISLLPGYEYFNVASSNVAITLELPDPTLVSNGSRIVIHNLGFNAASTLGKTAWTLGTGFSVAPSYANVSTASIPAYSKGSITTLTSRVSDGVWIKEVSYGSTIPVGTSTVSGKAYFAREDDVTATVSLNLGNIPTATNHVITVPNANVDLGKVLTSVSYAPSTGTLSVSTADAVGFTTSLVDSVLYSQVLTTATAVVIAATTSSRRYALAYTTGTSSFNISAVPTSSFYLEIEHAGNTQSPLPVTLTGTTGDLFLGDNSDDTYGTTSATINLFFGEIVRITRVTATGTRFGGAAGWQITRSRMILHRGILGSKNGTNMVQFLHAGGASFTTNSAVTFPATNVNLGRVSTSVTYSATTGVLAIVNADTSTNQNLSLSPTQWTVTSDASFTALPGISYLVNNTNDAARTYSLPASPIAGQTVVIRGNFASWTSKTIGANGSTIDGASADMTLLDNGTWLFMCTANGVWVSTFLPLSPTQWTVTSDASFTALPGISYLVNNTNEGVRTYSLPASPIAGQTVVIRGNFASWTSKTIGANGSTIDGAAADLWLRKDGTWLFMCTANGVWVSTFLPLSYTAGSYINVDGPFTLPVTSGDRYYVQTDASGAILTLPASPIAGNTVEVITASNITLIMARNGNTIAGSAANYVISKTGIYKFVYSQGTWNVFYTDTIGTITTLPALATSYALARNTKYFIPTGYAGNLLLALPLLPPVGTWIEIADPYNTMKLSTGGIGTFTFTTTIPDTMIGIVSLLDARSGMSAGATIRWVYTANTRWDYVIIPAATAGVVVLLDITATQHLVGGTRYALPASITQNLTLQLPLASTYGDISIEPAKGNNGKQVITNTIVVNVTGSDTTSGFAGSTTAITRLLNQGKYKIVFASSTFFSWEASVVKVNHAPLAQVTAGYDGSSLTKTLVNGTDYIYSDNTASAVLNAPGGNGNADGITNGKYSVHDPIGRSYTITTAGNFMYPTTAGTGAVAVNTSLVVQPYAKVEIARLDTDAFGYPAVFYPANCIPSGELRICNYSVSSGVYSFIGGHKFVSNATSGTSAVPIQRTVTCPDTDVYLGDIPSISNFNSNTVSNNGTILSRNSSSNAVNGVVLLSGDSLKTGFGYTIAGAVVAQTGKGSTSYFRPAVFDTLLTDSTSFSQISNPLTLTSVAGTANKPYAGAPAGSAFWTLAGGLDQVAVHTLTFACSVSSSAGNLGVFSGQRRIMVRRLNATDTYTIDNIQTIGTDAVSAGITGVSVAITLDSDRLNIVISQTTAASNQILTSAELHTLVTSLG